MASGKTGAGGHAADSATLDDSFTLDDILARVAGNFDVGANAITTPYSLFPVAADGPFFASTPQGGVPTAPPLAAIAGYTTKQIVGAGGHLSFNLNFKTADIPADAKQMSDVIAAAQLLSDDIVEKTPGVTLNIGIDFSGTGGGALGGPTPSYFYAYSAVRDALLANAANGDTNFNFLPTTLPNGATQIWVPNAEAKALGLKIPGSIDADDGVVTFSTGISDSLLEGVALHEITHALGRIPSGPTPDLFDLTRFTSPGNALFSQSIPAAAAYFSVDGGVTNLVNYGVNSDPSDFLNQTPNANDPFNEIYSGATIQGLTQVDLTQLDVLGFNTIGAAAAPCYATGTAIRTARGDVAVERLRVGDVAITATGERRPVVWIGRRSLDLARHPDPAAVQPVRVEAGAFGEGLPYRDLWLSPGHSVAFEGALIPIRHLVNDRSVAQQPRERVEYWHVELDRHDVLLAEGLPAKSYLDCGNRNGFLNGGAFVEAHPDFRPRSWRETCLPLAHDGPAVVAAKRRLIAELAARGETVVGDDDAHLIVDGRRIDPSRRSDRRLEFALTPGAREIVLRSRVFVPAHSVPESRDPRALGVSVARIEIDGADLDLGALDDAGWHEAERDGGGAFTHRWTSGQTRLPSGAQSLIVDLAGQGYYWRAAEAAQMSSFAA